MDTITSALVSFGLNVNEVKVYRQILRERETNPYALARATGIPRTSVYEILSSLAFKELIELKKSDGFTKQQTRILAKDPSFIRSIITSRRNELAHVDAKIVHILPMLRKDYLPSMPDADFQFFPGIEGAQKVFVNGCLDDIDLPEYVFNYKIADDTFGRDVINAIADKENCRARKNIPKEIVPLTDWTRHCLTYQFGRDPKYIEATNIRYIDQKGFDFSSKISVKDTRVWIVSVKGQDCWGMIMRSKSYVETLIAIFNALWITATPVTPQVISQWGKNEFLAAEKNKAR